jgi:hypothetical protein
MNKNRKISSELDKIIYANALLYILDEPYNIPIPIDIYEPNNYSLFCTDMEQINDIIKQNNIIYTDILPDGLEIFELEYRDELIFGTNMPQSLKIINFGHNFMQSIPINILPYNLIKISFGKSFNIEFLPNVLPPMLKILELGQYYNQKFKKDVLPKTLTHLSFSTYSLYNQEFEEGVLPESLEYLSFNGHTFDTHFEYELCYQNVGILEDDSSRDYDKPFRTNVLPKSLIYLKLSKKFNQKIGKNVLPNNLKYLIFGTWYDKELEEGVLPESLLFLKFDIQYNKKLNKLPNNLKTLILGQMFDKYIDTNILPNSLELLSFGTYFNQTIDINVLPSKLKYLYLGLRYNKKIVKNALSSSLLHIQIYNINDIHYLPNNLISLTIMKNDYVSSSNDEIGIFTLFPNLLYLRVFLLYERFQCIYYINMLKFDKNSNHLHTVRVSLIKSKIMENKAKEIIQYIKDNDTKGNIIFEDLVKHALHPNRIKNLLNMDDMDELNYLDELNDIDKLNDII